MDANLVATQWGLLGLFGVVVTLLIPRADEYYRTFLRHGGDEDHNRARRWADVTRWTPLGVLLAVVALATLGSGDVEPFSRWPPRKDAWLLLTPIVAQIGFTVVVYSLVRKVPRRMAILPLTDSSARSERWGQKSLLQFMNLTDDVVDIYWVPPHGPEQSKGSLESNDDITQLTYAGHVWSVATRNDGRRTLFRADDIPRKAVIRREEPGRTSST